MWHDLALYRVDCGSYVVEIVAAQTICRSARPVRSHVISLNTFEDAVSYIERHPAADDVLPGITTSEIDLETLAVAPAVVVQQAASIARVREDVGRRYRAAASAFLTSMAWYFP